MQDEANDMQSLAVGDNGKPSLAVGDNGKRNLLSIGEASEYLGVSIDTLRRWEKKGRIEPYRSPGGHRHYSKIDLDKLFDKKYVRDEPTTRTSGPYEEKLPPEISPERISSQISETPKPHPFSMTPGVYTEDRSQNPSKTVEEPTYYPSLETPQETLRETPPQVNEYSLPPWRSSNMEYSTSEVKEEISREVAPSYTQPPVIEPAREIRVPDTEPVRVIQSEALMTSEEAYFRQQSVSILHPQPKEASAIMNTTSSQIAQAGYKTESPTTSEQASSLKDFTQSKNFVIYVSAGIGVLILVITWFLLWRSSQAVLSPIP